MNIILSVNRYYSGQNMTLSTLVVDGTVYYGLEPGYLKAINPGIYSLGFRNVGGKHNKYTKLFPGMHNGMIEVKNVEGRKYILWHIGNKIKDTKACLVVGLGAEFPAYGGFNTEENIIKHSRNGYKKLYEYVSGLLIDGHNVFARYVNL